MKQRFAFLWSPLEPPHQLQENPACLAAQSSPRTNTRCLSSNWPLPCGRTIPLSASILAVPFQLPPGKIKRMRSGICPREAEITLRQDAMPSYSTGSKTLSALVQESMIPRLGPNLGKPCDRSIEEWVRFVPKSRLG